MMNLPPGFSLPAMAATAAEVLIDMFDDVERCDKVVLAVRNAVEFRQSRADNSSTKSLLRDGTRFIIELDRVDMTEGPEHFEIVSGAASDLEDLRILGRPDRSADQLLQDPAPRLVPPVPLIEVGHLAIGCALHQPNTHWRLRA